MAVIHIHRLVLALALRLVLDLDRPQRGLIAERGSLAAGQEEVYRGAQAEQFAQAFFSDHRTLEKRLASFV
jgi:hypothetical protein